MGRTPELTDDRGRIFELHRLKLHLVTGNDSEGILSHAEMRELRSITRRNQPKLRTLAGFCMLATPLWMSYGVFPGWIPLGSRLQSAFCVIMFMYLGWRTAFGYFVRSEDLVTMLKKWNRCLSCATTLEGLPVEADGCRVCPECGAAWIFQQNAGD